MRAVDVVRRVAPKARSEYVQAFELGDALLSKAQINTSLRLSHFMAQALAETGGLTIAWESGNYTHAERLFEIFGEGNHTAAISMDEAEELVAMPMPEREKAIFERVYGLGNPKKAATLGNTHSGDGWRYRGGGILQTTGGFNYKSMGDRCGVDFYNSPELIVTAEHALKPALAEWTQGGLNSFADQDDLLAISRKINLGDSKSKKIPNGWGDRQAWFKKVRPLIETVDFQIASAATTIPEAPAIPTSPIITPDRKPGIAEQFADVIASLFGRRKS